jgi:hypothetical protein
MSSKKETKQALDVEVNVLGSFLLFAELFGDFVCKYTSIPGTGVALPLPVSTPPLIFFLFFFFRGTTAGFDPYSPSDRCVEQVRQIAPSGGKQKTVEHISHQTTE